MRYDSKPAEVKIFVTHQWYAMQYPIGTVSDYEQIRRWLEKESRWLIDDRSVPPELGRYDTSSVREIKAFLARQMAECDVIINAAAGVAFHSRPWFRREARLANSKNAGMPPVLAVRPESAYW